LRICVRKERARKLLRMYTDRVHGTYIQEKACSLVWHYADCDQDWGAMQARELTDHLEDILETDEVDIIPGQCRVEVHTHTHTHTQHTHIPTHTQHTHSHTPQTPHTPQTHHTQHTHTHTRAQVRPKTINKGVAVELLLRTIEKKKPVDFVLCVGDDRSDEVCQ
jgi:trehalose 6-phosphate synthase/phosphatase